MIQIIGLIVGIYVLLRSLSFATRSGDRQENTAVRVFAGLTFFAVFILISMLLMTGTGSEATAGY